VALICAAWFALTGWIWTWLFAIFFAYPFGLLALFLYRFERKKNPENTLNRRVLWILITGWMISIVGMLLVR
jgi:membrane protein implicated in regulation of membrane protease activity